jgi:hypothetical protein
MRPIFPAVVVVTTWLAPIAIRPVTSTSLAV